MLQDVLHLMKRVASSPHHEQHLEYCQLLSLAILVPYEDDDKRQSEEHLQRGPSPMTFKEALV